ncbi:uncharacterized protein LOC120736340 isoform X2 [Simochromis diagramma]|uniref:uncharacterized protein LOC120736340 isoform X2 n=1 Tax=Simochromis diagramma TaxID=43689 RepID=UPI001A7EF215|nr:uncharacterized protein LOC120736340 isoform X2 [Simochromis diagramma]
MAVLTFSWPCWILMLVVVATASTFAVQTKTAESGKDVTLPCQAPHNNLIGVKWRKADLGEEYVYLNRRGQPQPQGQHQSFKNWVDLQDRQMKYGDLSLTLKNVTRSNTGTYECLVFEDETVSWKSLSNISLTVVDPGQPGGDTEDGGKEDQSVGLKVGLTVCTLLLFAVIAGIIYKFVTCKEKNSHDLPADQDVCLKQTIFSFNSV